jgi:hypothetical protein
MPPRYAYWTILIDNKPTAFRAREKEELLPTLQQLKRTSKDVVMKWFAQGRLWESPEQSRAMVRSPKGADEKRGNAWRPGGQHKDPRDRFKKGASSRGERPSAPPPWRDKPPGGSASTDRRPWSGKPQGPASSEPRPWRDKPPGGSTSRDRRPWSGKPQGPASSGPRPWRDKPPGGSTSRDRRPWSGKPQDGQPHDRATEPQRDNNRRDRTPSRREARPVTKPHTESPTKPPPPEKAAIKPKPPERE